MRLTASELGALELGLAMLRAERPPDERKAINGALDRLRAAMVHIPSDAVATGQREAALPEPGDTTTLAAVQHAMAARRKVAIRYRGGSKETATDRTVHPYALVVASGNWYLLGYCESSSAIRSFRLDRIEHIDQNEEAYEIPATFSL
jgi:proteasome accessory factor C